MMSIYTIMLGMSFGINLSFMLNALMYIYIRSIFYYIILEMRKIIVAHQGKLVCFTLICRNLKKPFVIHFFFKNSLRSLRYNVSHTPWWSCELRNNYCSTK
mgnify:CR=1 FL=1